MGFTTKIVFFLTNQKHPTKCEFINFISYLSNTPCVRIVVASVFHKNITGSGKLDISEALS